MYYSGTGHAPPEVVRGVWRAAIDVLRPVIVGTLIDLIPNSGFDDLDDEIRQGLDFLTARSNQNMGVWFDLDDDEVFRAFRAFGIESIHCLAYDATASEEELRRGTGYPVAYNHDGGWSVSFDLTGAEYVQLTTDLTTLGLERGVLEGPIATEQAAK
jgi:hypothetical protein